MRKLFCALAVGLVSVGVSPAFAATLTARDLFNTSDGLLTFDSSTGLEWLDVTATAGLSFNDIINGVGNVWIDAYDFRYATVAEVEHFFTQAGWDGVVNWRPESEAAATTILGLWGSMASIQPGANYALAITGDDADASGSTKLYSTVSLEGQGSDANIMPITTSSGSGTYCQDFGETEPCPIRIPIDGLYNLRGHALVRAEIILPGCGPSGGVPPKCNPSVVPLPASLPLMLGGLLGLGWLGRRSIGSQNA